MEKLFVYGFLKNPKLQKEVIGRVVKGKSDVLDGYKKSTIIIEGEEYPIIIPSPSDFVKGFVIPITGKELTVIDKYETAAYIRVRVTLKSGTPVWVYGA